jgi:hypothetical protein
MPARVGRRTAEGDTQRLNRALDRPVRVLADGEAVQGEAGRAGRDTFSNTERRPRAVIGEPAPTIIGLLSPT